MSTQKQRSIHQNPGQFQRQSAVQSLILAVLGSVGWVAAAIAQPILPAADGTGTQVLPGHNASGDPQSFLIQGGTQSGHNLFHSFESFGLERHQIANFLTNPDIQNILGRVTGGNASMIDGSLQVLGSAAHLYLINPAGIVFGPNARLDLMGAFTATTATGIGFAGGQWNVFAPAHYAALTGNPNAFVFATAQPGSIVNSGDLTVAAGQRLTVLGGSVVTTGTLSAPGGEITIMAVEGDRVVRLSHSGMVLSLDLQPLSASPVAGSVPFTPLTLPQLLTGGGLIHATAVVANSDGTISLNGSTQTVSVPPGTALISGALETRSVEGRGGNIDVLGDRLAVIGGVLDASGTGGGGVVRIGGDQQGQGTIPNASMTVISADSRIAADAQGQGNGGRIIVWSDRTTRFQGSISARGGEVVGDGGFVETSGAIGLDVRGGRVDTNAAAGVAGTWLIDPSDITIAAEGETTVIGNPDFFSPLDRATINVDTITRALLTNNVTITTAGAGAGNGDIFLTAPINSEVPGRSLTLTSRFLIPSNEARINLGANSNLILNLNAINPDPTPPANTVRDAISTIGAVGAATINLGAGTYIEEIQIGEIARLTIEGAGSGNTILSGNNQFRVIGSFGNSDLTLSNLAIANGRAPEGESGGGIFNSGRLTIRESVIEGNFASLDGGGIESFGPNAVLTIRDTFIRNNVAAVDGGAIFNRGELQIENSTLSNNQAGNNGGGVYNEGRFNLINSLIENNTVVLSTGTGGGMTNLSEATVNVTGSTLRNNTAYSGGGIYNNGTAIVGSSLIENNRATFGAGLTNDFGTLRVQNGTLIRGNVATDAGGLTNFNGMATLDTITIINNTAVGSGGGIVNNANSTMTIFNSTIQDNRSTFGGGITNFNNARLNITGSVIDGNRAIQGGGGIDNVNNSSLELNEMTLRNNTAPTGGGILSSENSAIAVRDSLLTRNSAGNGGAIFVGNSVTLNVSNSQFLENRTTSDGAGIYQLGEVVINNSNFTNNEARDGAGIHQASGNLTINETLFDGNRASNAGGAIEADSSLGRGNIAIQRSRFLNNEAIFGGGIATFNANQVTVEDSFFENNRASTSGGAINNDRAVTLAIANSTFVNNRTAGQGGAIANYGNATLRNLTLSRNAAVDSGGGLFNTGSLVLSSSTLTLNTASNGGGIRNNLAEIVPGRIEVNNSIIAGNTAAGNIAASTADVSGIFNDQGNNLIGIAQGSRGFTLSTQIGSVANPLNPLLAPLGDYGGTAPTHALLPGSLAIDAGGSQAQVLDQRGINRVGVADIGAFESRGFVLTPSAGTNQTVLVNADFASPLSVRISSSFGEPVDGGQVIFRAPEAGASWNFLNPSLTLPIRGGVATTPITANATAGAFTITAATSGAIAPVFFNLSNLALTIPPAPPVPQPSPPQPSPPQPSRPQLPFQPRSLNPEIPLRPAQPLLSAQPESARRAIALSVHETFVQWLESILNWGYRNYWELPQKSELTLTQIQNLLRSVQGQKNINFAVIYAVFLPTAANGTLLFNPLYPETYLENRLTQRMTQIQDSDQLALLLISATGEARLYPIGVSRREVLSQAHLWRITTSDPEDDASFKPLSRQFYTWLLAPLEQELQQQQITNLIFVLDRGLRTLPLAAMMTGDRYIIERYGVSVVPSLGLTDTRLTPLAPRTALLMGIERFEEKAPLPAVPVEVRTIGTYLSAQELWLNEGVTLSNLVRQENTQQPEILHLATHAAFNPGSPNDSYIQLWNERLTLAQMRSLPWDLSNLSLLTLSACTTALGSAEAELGFTGLAAAIGVRATLGSVWAVSDLGTLALMVGVYDRVRTAPGMSQALRDAQLSLLRGETRIENGQLITRQGLIPLPPTVPATETTQFNHPFYWSGFTLVGSPW